MTESYKNDIPIDAARLIQEVLAELGWSANVAAITEEVRRLDIGLPIEDEFSVICAWLGKCQLLHKLSQQQVPVTSRTEFQVPDLLAKFSTQTGKSPVLIEVKSKKGKQLSFKPDYLLRLQNYADLVGMPLLIAWKFHSFWMLFEARHMKKATTNFNITLETAARESLLGVLAGDVAYKIGANAGVHFRFRKNKLIKTELTEVSHTEQWMAIIDEVAFTNYEGVRLTDLDNEVQSLFTAWDLNEKEEHSDTHIYLSFVAGDEGMQFAHMAIVRLLNWKSAPNEKLNWRGLLRKDPVIENITNFSAALDTALRKKIVSHVFHMQPQVLPDFLS